MARPEGLEPPTTWFEARYSIQLSYGRVVWMRMAAQYKRRFHILTRSSRRGVADVPTWGLVILAEFGIHLCADSYTGPGFKA
jgi:hypothetical protein